MTLNAGKTVDPGIESILECSIETASDYQLGQPIIVKGTLHNAGTSGIWVLSWGTFLDSEWRDCVLLSHEGSAVSPTGIVVTRVAPGPEAYLLIPPGESVAREIDLTQKFAITELGEYEVSFRLWVHGALAEGSPEPPADERAISVALVESKKATFRTSGDAPLQGNVEASAWTPSAIISQDYSFPSQPIEPKFSGFTQEQEMIFRKAYSTAYAYILDALNRVTKSIDVNSNALYSQWFDCPRQSGRLPGWQQRRAKVIDTLFNMAGAMSTEPPVTVQRKDNDPNCGIDTLAYAVLGWRVMGVCPLFWSDAWLEVRYSDSADWVRAFAVVHEISHCAARTKDIWYLWSNCEQLAWEHPDDAVENANNYALYVMLVEGGRLPMPDKYAVRCYDKKRDKFLGWLSEGGNWVYLTGTDPDNPDDPTSSGLITVYWYVDGQGRKFLCPTYASRYLSDNGDGSPGAVAAFNLWARSHELDWTEPDCRIFKKDIPDQCLAVLIGSETRQVVWGTDLAPGGTYDLLRCEFVMV